jgi:glutamine phosphoribosylpyrophosphate amidotransferase
MCGIVGLAGNIRKKARDAFDDLLWVDAIRGADGTGLASINRHGVISILKGAGNTAHLRQRPEYKTILERPAVVLLGHNRAKTRGGDDADALQRDAHPFMAHHIVGAHNGTLSARSWKALNVTGIDRTDSFSIFHAMAWSPPRSVIERMEGDSAIVWYNRFEKTLNMWRNKGRPLYYAYSKDKKLLVWASEIAMIYLTMDRNGIEFDVIHELPVNHLFKWEVPKRNKSWNTPNLTPIKGGIYFDQS